MIVNSVRLTHVCSYLSTLSLSFPAVALSVPVALLSA